MVGALGAHEVGAILEAQVLVAPHQVGQVRAHGQRRPVGGQVREALPGVAQVEQVLDEDVRVAVHGEGDGVGGAQAHVAGLDVGGQLVGGVPAGVVALGVELGPEGVVAVHEGRRAVHVGVRAGVVGHALVLLGAGHLAQVVGAAAGHHAVNGPAQAEIEGAHQEIGAAVAPVHGGHVGVQLGLAAHELAFVEHGFAAAGRAVQVL